MQYCSGDVQLLTMDNIFIAITSGTDQWTSLTGLTSCEQYFNYFNTTTWCIYYCSHDSSSPADPPQLTATIPDLTPATSYEVAIAANNVVGNSSYSRPVTMTTREIGKTYK